MATVNGELLYREIGRRVKALRKAKDMKQEYLASRINLSRASLVNIEKGRHHAHLSTLYNIASALECQLADLLPPPDEITPTVPDSFAGKIRDNEKGVVANVLNQAKAEKARG